MDVTREPQKDGKKRDKPLMPPPLEKVEGVWDFAGADGRELSFRKGDHLDVLNKDDKDWWFARKDGLTGFIPSSYVSTIFVEDSDDDSDD